MEINGVDLPYCWQEGNDSHPQGVISNTGICFIAWLLAHICEHCTVIDWKRGFVPLVLPAIAL